MGLAQSPKIVTDSLVFCYDQSNIKSYRGPAISNLAKSILASGTGTTTGYSSVGGTETVNIPQIGPTAVTYNIIQNNYTSFTPNSNNCCPAPLAGYGGFAVSPSTLYTYAIVYRVLSGYTHPNFMYRYEYTANGGTYVTEAGVHNTSNRVELGDGWYWAWGTFTTQATTNWINNAASFYYRYSDKTDKFSVAKVLIAAGNYTALHPKYWPSQDATISTTQAITDLSTRKTTTASNLAYSSNGAFSFNGVNSWVNIGPSTRYLPMPQFTLESWHRSSGLGAGMSTNGLWGLTYAIICNIFSNGSATFYTYNSDTSTYFSTVSTTGVNLLNNTWTHLAYVVGATTSQIYVNGVLNATVNNSGTYSGTNQWSSMDALIGNNPNDAIYRFNGEIPVAKIYNRALTAAEVQQNFNALRGRYGI